VTILSSHPAPVNRPRTKQKHADLVIGADDAERAVLGCLLRHDSAVLPNLAEDDFRIFAHRLVWRAIADLKGECKVADPFTVFDWLASRNLIGQSGEVRYSYFGDLMTFAGTPGGLFQYVEIVRENARRREVFRLGEPKAVSPLMLLWPRSGKALPPWNRD
jgi:replicative DNA helicase